MRVIFTWDDNLKDHFSLTAPLFEKYGFRCTFYPVAGGEGYDGDGFRALSEKGFEIGSHGCTHDDFTKMTLSEARENMLRSIEAIENTVGRAPETFAFPYHRSTGELTELADSLFKGTRNTLKNSVRADVFSKMTFEDMKGIIKKSGEDAKSVVFAGHGAFIDEKDKKGYEPIKISELEKLLGWIKGEKIDVMTMREAYELIRIPR